MRWRDGAGTLPGRKYRMGNRDKDGMLSPVVGSAAGQSRSYSVSSTVGGRNFLAQPRKRPPLSPPSGDSS